ncbi:class III poly(R)-hydroxyalkanoic acid synthase subunit PhaC [Desulfococcaceae bacterium HSG9]|nr:class III poly(R)-hydroxyalkanoic acid synthase subunit PhaC [Desulfococcaceae bacterium HSG9]
MNSDQMNQHSGGKIPVNLILSNLAKDAEKARTRVEKASDVLLDELDTQIAATPYETVHQEDRVKLKHYKPEGELKIKTPLLLVYALINRETMLDLQPGKSVVEKFQKSGVNLYMIDWGYPTRKDRYLTIDDHVNGYIGEMVDFIMAREKVKQVNLMGICMGGSFCVMYAALNPGKIKNLITTVTPTHFDTDQGLLHVWMKNLDVDRLLQGYGNMPGDLMNFGFLLLNPARLMIDKYVGFMENIDNKAFVQDFVRMEKWIFDSPDVPGETFRQFIKDCYHKNLLIQNKMVIGGRRIDLKKITMPLLNYYGIYDHLVPPAACEQLTSAVGSKDTQDMSLKTGHIGIYVSSRCQQEFTPKIVKWLMERDQPLKAVRKRTTRKKTAAKAAITKKTAVKKPVTKKTATKKTVSPRKMTKKLKGDQ